MSAAIQLFQREGIGSIRCLEIEGTPYFVGKDVAVILGYQNPSKALTDHVAVEDKTDGVTIRDSIGREQTPVLINESGLYSLILSSKLPKAKEFKHWVTSEVLPSIRKTGKFDAADSAKAKSTAPDRIPFGKLIDDYIKKEGYSISEFSRNCGIRNDVLNKYVKEYHRGNVLYPAPITVNRAAKGMCLSYEAVASKVMMSSRDYSSGYFLGGAPRDKVAQYKEEKRGNDEANLQNVMAAKLNPGAMDFSGLASKEFIGELLILIGKYIKAGDLEC